ncbi:HalOD1 output domain-containing protein [Natronosalvus rutilus]|uniref:Halobacterial output domain-containing protein n=1 Tax=Natronosalvus rutilus TaxID=2953753 RepID=A0A9E7SVA0_9EURY|nr:HalOD1 output domain-containing protein [Natronosalvus rutilus]UTF55644.1 hypothetical protein NGM29_19810 [Natronosalvus rutilus]
MSESSSNKRVSASTTWGEDSTNTPVYAVVSAVAEVTGTGPIDLPPLQTAIDPDALNALFTSQSSSALDQVQFQYAGFEIAVFGDGVVRIYADFGD